MEINVQLAVTLALERNEDFKLLYINESTVYIWSCE